MLALKSFDIHGRYQLNDQVLDLVHLLTKDHIARLKDNYGLVAEILQRLHRGAHGPPDRRRCGDRFIFLDPLPQASTILKHENQDAFKIHPAIRITIALVLLLENKAVLLPKMH